MTDVEQTLQKAIELEKRVKIIYEGKEGFSERNVKPNKIENGELHAYCYMRRAKRVFKLEKILSAQPIIEKSGQK